MNKLTLKARDWHGWLSVILLAPLLLVGLTAFFIAHSKALGLKDIDVSRLAGWLPGYRAAATPAHAELRTALTLADGTQWLGTRNGVFEHVRGQPPVAHLPGLETRDLHAGPDGLFAATKGGLWRRELAGGDWQKVAGGEFWSVGRDADGGWSASSKEKGLLRSTDGRRWQAVALPELPVVAGSEPVSLGKLMLDLHTGKAFFGKNGEWIWIDLLAAVWAFLAGTGLYLWWRTQTKRRDAAQQRAGGRT